MGYTKGPWKANGLGVFKKDCAEDELGLICLCQIDKSDEEAVANAQLIAAAPDMYEALKDIIADFNLDYRVTIASINKAVRAIAKAEEK